MIVRQDSLTGSDGKVMSELGKAGPDEGSGY